MAFDSLVLPQFTCAKFKMSCFPYHKVLIALLVQDEKDLNSLAVTRQPLILCHKALLAWVSVPSDRGNSRELYLTIFIAKI